MVCSNKVAWKRLARRHSRNGPWTHECCFEVNVFVCWKCIEDVEFCLEVIDLYVDIECRDCKYFEYYYSFYVWVSLFRVLSGCCLVVMYLGCGMSFEEMYVYVGSGCHDRDNFDNYMYVYVVLRLS